MVDALWDTGAQVSLVSERWLCECENSPEIKSLNDLVDGGKEINLRGGERQENITKSGDTREFVERQENITQSGDTRELVERQENITQSGDTQELGERK